MAECYLINSKSSKAESVTYTWQNTAVAAEENIFDITLPDYMNEDGGECDVIMQFKYGDSITTTNRSGYMSVYLDNDTGKSYIGGICITGNSAKYTGRRISLGFCNSSDGFNTYHFTIRNMFGSLYLEGTSTSLYGSDKTQITSRYVIQHTNTATTHSIQIYSSVAVVDTGSATITIREVKR